MPRPTRAILILSLGLISAPSFAQEPAPPLDRAKLRADVFQLASREFAGRRGAGGDRAVALIADRFQKLGLEPLFDGSYEQPLPGRSPGDPPIGRNVGAILRGSDPTLRDECVMLTAHFDHLGVHRGVLFPGADDNASSVAMTLEIARALSTGQPPRRSVIFVGFDLEEDGLVGSRHYVEHPPVPLDRVRLFITADMIGRSLGGICEPDVFVLGSEFSPGFRPRIAQAAEGQPVRVGVIGSDLLLVDRSDYGPFRGKQVPHLFFTTGETPVYHTPDDIPETLDYDKLLAVSRVLHTLVVDVTNADTLPGWAPTDEPSLEEAQALRHVMGALIDHQGALEIPPFQRALLKNTVASLDDILRDRSFSPGQRTAVVRVAQLLLVTVL